MNLLYNGYSDVGQRKKNEDSYFMGKINSQFLFMVADGLGGHDLGEEASKLAIKIIKEDLNLEETIEQAISHANSVIYEKNRENNTRMFTTITIAYIDKTQTILAHVGDSRIYTFEDGRIYYQSQDHSVSQMAVIVGEISLDQIRNHPDKNKLTKVLGAKETVKPTIKRIMNNEYDSILLCSDGFWEYVLENDMEIMRKKSKTPNVWLFRMREILEQNKSLKNDNNTAIAIIKEEKE